MNIFKKIALLRKIEKSIKRAKNVIDEHEGTAKEVRKVLENIKGDFDALVALLPSLKDLYNDLKDLLTND